jgi:glutaredoxin 1
MITIYGHERCSFCIKSKRLADRYNLKYEWKDTDSDSVLNDLKTKLPDVKTVPQIWWDSRHIGGYEDFAAEIENTLGGHGEQKL